MEPAHKYLQTNNIRSNLLSFTDKTLAKNSLITINGNNTKQYIQKYEDIVIEIKEKTFMHSRWSNNGKEDTLNSGIKQLVKNINLHKINNLTDLKVKETVNAKVNVKNNKKMKFEELNNKIYHFEYLKEKDSDNSNNNNNLLKRQKTNSSDDSEIEKDLITRHSTFQSSNKVISEELKLKTAKSSFSYLRHLAKSKSNYYTNYKNQEDDTSKNIKDLNLLSSDLKSNLETDSIVKLEKMNIASPKIFKEQLKLMNQIKKRNTVKTLNLKCPIKACLKTKNNLATSSLNNINDENQCPNKHSLKDNQIKKAANNCKSILKKQEEQEEETFVKIEYANLNKRKTMSSKKVSDYCTFYNFDKFAKKQNRLINLMTLGIAKKNPMSSHAMPEVNVNNKKDDFELTKLKEKKSRTSLNLFEVEGISYIKPINFLSDDSIEISVKEEEEEPEDNLNISGRSIINTDINNNSFYNKLKNQNLNDSFSLQDNDSSYDSQEDEFSIILTKC